MRRNGADPQNSERRGGMGCAELGCLCQQKSVKVVMFCSLVNLCNWNQDTSLNSVHLRRPICCAQERQAFKSGLASGLPGWKSWLQCDSLKQISIVLSCIDRVVWFYLFLLLLDEGLGSECNVVMFKTCELRYDILSRWVHHYPAPGRSQCHGSQGQSLDAAWVFLNLLFIDWVTTCWPHASWLAGPWGCPWGSKEPNWKLLLHFLPSLSISLHCMCPAAPELSWVDWTVQWILDISCS